jgi:hypothetical protein
VQAIHVAQMANASNWELVLINVFVIDIIQVKIVAHFCRLVTLIHATMVETVHWMHRKILFVHAHPDGLHEDVKLK